MADNRRGKTGEIVVGKPYSIDDVYVDEIQDYVHNNNDTQSDFYDLDKMFSFFMDEYGRWKFNLNSTFYLIDVPDEVCDWFVCPTDMHWPSISWKVYGSTRLAWLLMKLNDVRDKNIFDSIKAGTRIRYLDYSRFVNTMLTNMQQVQHQAK